MRLNILGSGGCVPVPRPLCFCKICQEAREKGIPFSRTGPSLYLEDEAIVFDTPEDIRFQLLRENIKEVKHVFYTHWHPDHTAGWRIVEHINGVIRGTQLKPKIKVYLPGKDKKSFYKACDGLFYMEKIGYIEIIEIEDRKPIVIGKVKIIPLDFHRPDRVRFGYEIIQNNKKVIYAPCSIYQMEIDQYFSDLDLLLIERGWQWSANDRKKLPENHPYHDHVAIEENIDLVKRIKPKQTLLTHIGGSSHDSAEMGHAEFLKYCQNFSDLNITPAYDGQKIEL